MNTDPSLNEADADDKDREHFRRLGLILLGILKSESRYRPPLPPSLPPSRSSCGPAGSSCGGQAGSSEPAGRDDGPAGRPEGGDGI